MSKTPMYDPGTSEARSSWLAGLTEACNKISGVLNMETDTFTNLQLSEVFISNNDRCRIYQAPLGNKLWLTSPAPVFKKNGVVITPVADNFTIDYLGGSIAFDYNSRLTVNDTVTVDATYIIDSSGTLKNIISKVEEASNKADKFRGYYSTYSALENAIQSGSAGDYAIVGGSENTIYIWNSTSKKWESIVADVDLTDYYTKEQADTLLGKKENNIAAHGSTSASDSYYYGGRKTWQKLEDKIANTPIGEVDTSDSTAISPTDTVSSGLGKLQAQVNNFTHDIFGTGAPTKSTVGKIGQDYTNTSNGDKYHLTSIESGVYNWERYADCVVPSSTNNIAVLGANGQIVDSGKSIDEAGRFVYYYSGVINCSSSNMTHVSGNTWQFSNIYDFPKFDNRLITVDFTPTKWVDSSGADASAALKIAKKYNVRCVGIEDSYGLESLVYQGEFGPAGSSFDYGSIPVFITFQYAESV